MASTTALSLEDFNDWLNVIFMLCWALIMLWILLWIATCGNCCGLLTKCLCKPGGQFRWFRILVICNTTIMFITWIINFNPSLQFNPQYPLLYFTNVVSWVDLVVSLVGDIYLKFPNRDCCCRKKSSDVDVEAPPSGDTEEDEDSEGTPPSNRHTKHASNNSRPPSHNTKADERDDSVHPMHESVKETIYGDGTRVSVKTTVFSDGSKKVVKTHTAAPN